MIPAGLVALREALYALSGPLAALEGMDDATDLAEALLIVDEVASEAAQLKKIMAAHLASAMDSKLLEVEGVATFERHRDSKRTWDHPLVAGQVVEAARIDAESGEVLFDTARVAPLVDAFLGCAGIAYWRLGELRKLVGDLADKHCVIEHGDPTVTIRRVK